MLSLMLSLGVVTIGRILEHSPSFCVSCHEMRPSYDGWKASGAALHHPECIDCHSGEGIPGILESEPRGARMVGLHFWRYFGKQQPGPIAQVKMPEAFCLKCHATENVVISHTKFRIEGQTCADCHKHKSGWKFKGQVPQ